MAPIAEAFVQIRPDMSVFAPELQRGVNQALNNLKLPANVQTQVGSQLFGPGFQREAKTRTTGAMKDTEVPEAVQRTMAQRLFGPGFRNESGRAIQGVLSGIGLGQLAAQFSFFGPGGAAAAVLGGGLLVAANSAATLEQQLSILSATTGASEQELAQAGDAARALGEDLSLPGVSASDSAKAILELAKAGLDMKDAIAGAEGTLQLAVAAEIDTGTAAQIAAAGLNAFSLNGVEAVRVADLLAGASVAAQGDIGDMALALQQSAAVAAQAGLSIDQLVALITELAKQGILGSDAGTSIRTGLLRLIPTTKEAAQVMEALGIQIDDTRTLGAQLPQLFDQYQAALAKLNPTLRQTVLNQIFGTDAIRFATIAFQQGSQGLIETTDQVTVAGEAAKLAGSRTTGLKGELSDLASNAQSAGLEIGDVLVPALTDYLKLINFVTDSTQKADLTPGQVLIRANDIDNLKEAVDLLDTLNKRIQERGTNEVAEEAFARLSANLLNANRSAAQLDAIFEGTSPEVAAIGQALKDGIIDPLEIAKLSATEVGRIFLTALKPENLQDIPDETKIAMHKAEVFAHQEGEKTGKKFGEGIGDGISAESAQIIAAARRTLSDVQRQGNEQILESIRSARGELESLGASLGSALEDIIDTGPIADAIKDIDKQLDALQERTSRRQLRFDVSNAEMDLKEAQEAIAQVGKLTPAQKKSQDEFLKPFREKVKDAKAAVKEFDLTDHREDLEKTLAEQKKVADEGLQRIIDKFEEGKLSVGQFDALISKELSPHLAVLNKNKENLGFVFTRDFKRDMATLLQQAKDLAGFTGRAGTTPGTQTTKPAQTVQDVARQVADAEKALAQAIKDSKEKNTSENGSIITLLKQLVAATGSKPSPKEAKRPG